MKQEKWLAVAAFFVVAVAVLFSSTTLAMSMKIGATLVGENPTSKGYQPPEMITVPQHTEHVPIEAPPEPDPLLTEQLAILIYREAGGDACCDECRARVADVALNRVEDKRFPDTLEEVLTQKKQYGTMYWDGVTWPERAENPAEAEAITRARETAKDVLAGNHSELYGNGYVFQSEFPNLGDDEGRVTCCGIYFAKG